MKYGVYLPNFGPFSNARTLATFAKQAEDAGWDGFFIWDHVARPVKLPIIDPWIGLSAVAIATRKIRLGPMVTPIARRRPWKLARETVSLDHLSNGRLIFGAGLGSSGGSAVEWSHFGEEGNLRVRARMLDEGLDILNGLWSGEPFDYHGEHFKIGESQFLPTPMQFPHIPIWIGGTLPKKAPLKRAARWDGIFPIVPNQEQPLHVLITQLMEAVAFIETQRQDIDSPFDVVYRGKPTSGDDIAKSAEMVAPFAAAGATWWLEDISPRRFNKDWTENWEVERLLERVQQGPPKA